MGVGQISVAAVLVLLWAGSFVVWRRREKNHAYWLGRYKALASTRLERLRNEERNGWTLRSELAEKAAQLEKAKEYGKRAHEAWKSACDRENEQAEVIRELEEELRLRSHQAEVGIDGLVEVSLVVDRFVGQLKGPETTEEEGRVQSERSFQGDHHQDMDGSIERLSADSSKKQEVTHVGPTGRWFGDRETRQNQDWPE